MKPPDAVAANRWLAAWPDAVGFAAGLIVAWWQGWNTADLIWSLWLASLVVGYAMIAWGAFLPAVVAFREHRTGGLVAGLVRGVAMLAFFTVHFGLFHAAHAAMLNGFFPMTAGGGRIGWDLVGEVFVRYGWFLPVAALAERAGFRMETPPAEPPRTSVKADDIAARKARQALGSVAMFTPYKNVIRLHLLIFFFAAAHFLQWEKFAVYGVVYAAYFFPWRMLRPASARS